MIIFPMMGLSSRFRKAGYITQKYMLPLWNRSVFANVVLGFRSCFHSRKFVFIVPDDQEINSFVQKEINSLRISDSAIINLNRPTSGQLETVYLATKNLMNEEPLTIFNIDTIRDSFQPSELEQDCEGYIEVFERPGEHWSFILTDENQQVIRVAEKNRISSLCSTGLYHFSSVRVFNKYAELAIQTDLRVNGELYIAPLYQLMIDQGLTIRAVPADPARIFLAGLPEEYEELCRTFLEPPF